MHYVKLGRKPLDVGGIGHHCLSEFKSGIQVGTGLRLIIIEKRKQTLSRKVTDGVLKVEQGLLEEQFLVKQLKQMKT